MLPPVFFHRMEATSSMACLGGTVTHPRRWWRFSAARQEDPVPVWGRICDREKDRTSRSFCYTCPAYRGMEPNGKTPRTSVALNGDFYAMTDAEWQKYSELWEAALERADWDTVDALNDPEFAAFDRFLRGEQDIYSTDRLRRIGDPDAMARYAAQVREKRQQDREAYNEAQRRYRATHREHNRAYDRERKRRVRSMDPLPRTLEENRFPGGSNPEISVLRARAREGVHTTDKGGQS